jgi:hypothetical protein
MDNPVLVALLAHFEGVFTGPNGDYPAVMEALIGIDAARAAWKPDAAANSIWQIVEHLTASNAWAIDMLDAGEAAAPIWTDPTGGDAEWQHSLERLKASHQSLKASLARVHTSTLFERPLPDWPQTQLELMLSWAAHEAHHAGQIDYLKGLQAA